MTTNLLFFLRKIEGKNLRFRKRKVTFYFLPSLQNRPSTLLLFISFLSNDHPTPMLARLGRMKEKFMEIC